MIERGITVAEVREVLENGEVIEVLNAGKPAFVSVEGEQMTCLVCKPNRFKKGTTILPIERAKAIVLITDIPARVCENCGETYLDEETAQEVQDLANETLGRPTAELTRRRESKAPSPAPSKVREALPPLAPNDCSVRNYPFLRDFEGRY